MTTIAQERAALARVGRPLRTREQWGSRYSYADARAVTEPARYQFVHITITNPGNYSSDDAHARAVEAIGASRFPGTKISYNRLHFQSGRAMEGQPIGRRGAHTVNDKKLNACVTSGCPSRGRSFTGTTNLNYTARAYVICQNVGDTVTAAELDSLARSLAADRLAGFVTRDAAIHGHRCVAWKDCPASPMWGFMDELAAKVTNYVRNGFGPVPKPPTPPTPPPEDDMAEWTEAGAARAVEAGFGAYWGRYMNPAINGTGGKNRQEDEAWQAAMLNEAKGQTAALVRIADALEAAAGGGGSDG